MLETNLEIIKFPLDLFKKLFFYLILQNIHGIILAKIWKKKLILSNKNIWGLWIHHKDAILKLIDLINPYLKHADKRRGMEIVKNNILERNKKYNNQQDRRFYKLYLKEGIKI